MASETKLKIVVDAVNNSTSAFSAVSKNLDAINAQMKDTLDGMKSFGKVGAVTFAGLATGLGFSVKNAADLESLMKGLQAVSGSAEEATKQFSRLREVAKLPGLGLREALEGSVNLQAAGLSAEQSERSLKAFGNALATVGKGKAELSGVILALQQISAKGKVSAEEINQLNERLPQIRKAMQAAFGTADTEALNQMGIDSATFIDRIVTEFEKLPPVQESTNNNFENLQDNLFILSSTIGKVFLPAVNSILVSITPMIDAMSKWVDAHPTLTKAIVAVGLVVFGLTAALLPLALMLPGLVLLFTGLSAAFVAIATVTGGLVIATLGALGFAIYKIIGIVKLLKSDWELVWLGIKVVAANAANSVTSIVESMVNFIIKGVNKAIEMINKVIKLAQQVPGIGSKLSTISTLSTVNFGRINTDTIAANQLGGLQSKAPASTTVVNFSNNTFLDQDAAEKMGDMIMKRLGLSNAY